MGEAKAVQVQAEILKEEMLNCLKSEYSTESLPLLLHEVRYIAVYMCLVHVSST